VLRQFAEGRSIVVIMRGREGRAIGESLADGRRRLDLKRLTEEEGRFAGFALQGKWCITPTKRQTAGCEFRWKAESQKSAVNGVPGSRLFPSPAFPGMTGCWLPMVWFR